MMNSPPLDVLVVGAGPTGLALAAELARYGVRFRLVDRALDRVHESRALGVQARTLEVLERFDGVADAMVERGNRTVRLRLHFGRRTVPVPLFDIGVEDTAYPYLLFLSQAETERILCEHLGERGVAVERGTELTGFDPAGDGVRCTLRGRDGREESVTARYVVGCDGAHSTVRRTAGIAFEGGAYPQSFVLADVEADGIEPGWAHMFPAARGLLLVLPLGTPASWRVLVQRPVGEAAPVERAVELAEVQRLVDGYTGGGVRLRDPVWMTDFRLHNRGAAHYRSGRVFLAGDAAHIHSPAGAQGMNTGVQDAVNLGWKLGLVTTGRAGPGLLDTYEPERAPVGRRVRRFTDRAFTAGTSPRPFVRFARTRLAPRLLPLLLRLGPGRVAGLRTVSQLAIRYRSSPASQEGPATPRRGPRAGDRLPDAPIALDGRPSTLHRELAAPGYHLLLCGPLEAWGLAGGPGHHLGDADRPGGAGAPGTADWPEPTGRPGPAGRPGPVSQPGPVSLTDEDGRPGPTGHPGTEGRFGSADRACANNPGDPADLPGPIAFHRLTAYPAPGCLHDTGGHALRRLGLGAGEVAHFLVRPDGHIGYRAAGTELGGVRAYLARWTG
ncbi:FAD-dependent monooxygenase [Streptomyces pathocidini]|uniref:FAD-dependent monooxygenase n=1 Tax=Streptomyces pathocidini TaxID=1650571 RepID=UPI003400B2EF